MRLIESKAKKQLLFLMLIGFIIFLAGITYIIFFYFPPYDQDKFNKALETGDIIYCHKISLAGDFFNNPGLKVICIEILAQKNNDPSLCEELNQVHPIHKSKCYALYAHYKGDESICDEFNKKIKGICDKTFFDICQKEHCKTIEDYQ